VRAILRSLGRQLTKRAFNQARIIDFHGQKLKYFWREHVDTDPALMRPTDLAVSCADPTHAEVSLGWKAQTGMRDVVRKMVAAGQAMTHEIW
jgi:GDPmannose 4,6-dehydratase